MVYTRLLRPTDVYTSLSPKGWKYPAECGNVSIQRHAPLRRFGGSGTILAHNTQSCLPVKCLWCQCRRNEIPVCLISVFLQTTFTVVAVAPASRAAVQANRVPIYAMNWSCFEGPTEESTMFHFKRAKHERALAGGLPIAEGHRPPWCSLQSRHEH